MSNYCTSFKHITKRILYCRPDYLSVFENMSTQALQRFETRMPLSDSTNTYQHYLDSSESALSSPGSIYNALPGSESEIVPTFETGGRQRSRSLEQHLPFRSIHHPTLLDTITEKTSLNTLQLTAIARRKKSFSLNDISWITRKAKFWKSSSSSADTPRHFPIEYPRYPPRSPPLREPTPPKLPSFNTRAASEYRLPPPQPRFRDLLRPTPTLAEIEYSRQTSNLPRGALMRSEDGTLIRGRWKPSQSGHTGNSRSTNQLLAGQGLRESQIELCTVSNTVTTRSQHDPTTRAPAPRRSRWIKLVEKICYCCDDEEADQMPPTRMFNSASSPIRIV